jgi:hypothetical protein
MLPSFAVDAAGLHGIYGPTSGVDTKIGAIYV